MVIFAVASVCAEEDRHLLFREDFNDLKNWDALYFLKIKKHSVPSDDHRPHRRR